MTNCRPDPDPEIRINAAYVLQRLDAHTKECADRWWAVMRTLIVGFGTLTIFLAGLVATLAFRGHP